MRYVHEHEAFSFSTRSITLKCRTLLQKKKSSLVFQLRFIIFNEMIIVSFAIQLSFQVWTDQIQETLNSKKQGDAAFKGKDFVTTIECYTQVRRNVHYFLESQKHNFPKTQLNLCFRVL